MSKLVRNGTEAALVGRDPRVTFEQADPKDAYHLLAAKMSEEVFEWLMAEDLEQTRKELGDIAEVLWAMIDAAGIPVEEIVAQAMGKRNARGSFSDLMLLKVVADGDPEEEDDDDAVWRPSKEKVQPSNVPDLSATYSAGRGYAVGDGPWYSG